MQRAVLGGDVEVLIAANPCFGLDFAAVSQFVHEARASEADLTEIGRHMAGH